MIRELHPPPFAHNGASCAALRGPTNEGSGTCDMKPYVIEPDGNIQAAALNCPNTGCAIGDLYGQHGYFDNSLYSGAAVTVKACNTILFSSTGVSGAHLTRLSVLHSGMGRPRSNIKHGIAGCYGT